MNASSLQRLRRILLTFFLIVTTALVGHVTPADAAVISAVRLDATPTGGAILTVTLAGGIPTYHLVGSGTTEPAVLLDATTLGPVAPTLPGAGPLSGVTLAQTSTSSSLALHLTAIADVAVRVVGASLLVNVAPPRPARPDLSTTVALASTDGTGLGPVTRIVELKYADVSEVAGVLAASSTITTNDTFAPIQTNIGTNSLSGSFGGLSSGGGYANQQQPFAGSIGTQGVGQRVNDNIAIDRRLNAIVLSGSQQTVDALAEIIAKIDVPVRSVILETQIVELSETAARNIGLDFSPDGSGLIANAAASPNGYVIKSLNTGQGQVSLQAALYAQVSDGNAKIVAKPRILAQSGQPASILTGDAIPILTSIVVAGQGAVTTQQVNYVNVGVNLQIEPRVTSDGYVTSHIYSEVSSVSQIISGVPQISQRTASTIATVRDGEAFVIGGLLQDNEIHNLTKLPFFGDLPIIGQLFRHVNTSHTQTNLYIVVTPHIVAR